MISREFLGSMRLIRTQIFHIHESIEVIIISQDKNLIFDKKYSRIACIIDG